MNRNKDISECGKFKNKIQVKKQIIKVIKIKNSSKKSIRC